MNNNDFQYTNGTEDRKRRTIIFGIHRSANNFRYDKEKNNVPITETSSCTKPPSTRNKKHLHDSKRKIRGILI